MNKRIEQALYDEPNKRIKQFLYVLIVLGLIVYSMNVLDFNGVNSKGLGIAKNILKGIFTPDPKLLFRFDGNGVPYLLLETLGIAFLGTIIGAILAVPLAFISSSNIVPRWISSTGVFLIAAIRTFPTFVYGIMFIRVTGPGPFAGVLTLAVTSIGMIGKLYIDVIEELDQGIIEALDAAGCNTFEKIRYGVIPQLSSSFLSIGIYRFEINIKQASVLGLVGAGGIGAPLKFAMSSYEWSQAGAILCGLIILVLIVENLSSMLRNKLARG